MCSGGSHCAESLFFMDDGFEEKLFTYEYGFYEVTNAGLHRGTLGGGGGVTVSTDRTKKVFLRRLFMLFFILLEE